MSTKDIITRLEKLSQKELAKIYTSALGKDPGNKSKEKMAKKIVKTKGTNPADIFTCDGTATTYNSLKKDDLINLAIKCGVNVSKSDNKKDIVNKIAKKMKSAPKKKKPEPEPESEDEELDAFMKASATVSERPNVMATNVELDVESESDADELEEASDSEDEYDEPLQVDEGEELDQIMEDHHNRQYDTAFMLHNINRDVLESNIPPQQKNLLLRDFTNKLGLLTDKYRQKLSNMKRDGQDYQPEQDDDDIMSVINSINVNETFLENRQGNGRVYIDNLINSS